MTTLHERIETSLPIAEAFEAIDDFFNGHDRFASGQNSLLLHADDAF